ncbi:hypothetical protein, variant 1 [Aphanomyces invadans]|nr:hypothetical protein, variant 1 [Aphanomyces invadans]ETV92776.1 hypothetical protein, variant 1 [Aphanomyces invadans]|eukprot:XP_008878545.1 hypothetical protein, variant 1 [Aphanomyces invadans]
MAPPPLMQKTGRKVLDRNGRVVDEMKEDSIFVRLHDPNNMDRATNPYQPILRSNFRLKTINRLFQCHAHYIKDQFENVLWPKQWLLEVRPAQPGAPWCYDIVAKNEPEPVDDALDPRYEGETVVKIANVPKEVQEKDLRAWLIAGLVQEYEPILDAKFDIAVLTKKLDLLKQRRDEVPMMILDGKPNEQTETRQKLAAAMATQITALDDQLAKATKKLGRRTRLVESEPIELSFLKDGTEHRFVDTDVENDKEKLNWFADFKSLRGPELALLAIEKPDWGSLRLSTTRPDPTVTMDELDDPTHEVNMRMVRVTRVKHGVGDLFVSAALPTDDDFHFSSIDAMYSGHWVNGLKHDQHGIEYTNYGVYSGAFVYNVRDGHGQLVYGKGDKYVGNFDVPRSRYSFHSHDPYPKSLLPAQFQDGVPHGQGTWQFADGATYEGMMVDGRICGQGRYVSSTGVVEEGEFLDGQLHGEGFREEPNGHVEEGMFVHGVLDGFGTQRTKHQDVYEGSFESGVKTGRGVLRLHERDATLRGFWADDLPSGRGDLIYSVPESHRRVTARALGQDPATRRRNQVREASSASSDSAPRPLSAEFWYEGSFSEGKVKGRHRHVDVDKVAIGHVPFTTYGKSLTHMPFPTTVAAKMAKQSRRHIKNLHRRRAREAVYLADAETTNLR